MTKPNDVSQADWDVAAKATGAMDSDWSHDGENSGQESLDEAIEIVARVIMAEREACASVLDTLAEVIGDEIAAAENNQSRQILSTQRHAVQTGAAAIRRRSNA